MKNIFILIIILLPINLLAQNENIDTTFISEETIAQNNIDSMFSTWFVKKSIINNDSISYFDTLSHNFDIPDTVYMQRLQKIPTTFPLVFNQKVKKWIELYGKRRSYLMPTLLGLSKYYFPMFEQTLDAKGLPLELKYLPVIESSLNPRAVSRVGATGLWQFMYTTGKMYGLEITSLVDERRDPLKSTIAATEFLKDLYEIYGDWALVIAAYNCGPGNVNKAIKRSGGKMNFWEIYPYLPRETRGYVPAFIAVTYLMNYYDKHNFRPININIPLHTDTVYVKKKLHLMQVSEVMKIPIEQLRDLNPQYRVDILPGDIKPYSLRLPANMATRFIELEDSIYAYKDTIFFNPKNQYIEPPEFVPSRGYYPCSKGVPKGKTKLVYTVKSGDTYGFIANWYNVRVRDLKCWNNTYSDRLRVGQKIIVYVPKNMVNKYKKINTMSFEQKQAMVNKNIITTQNKKGKKLDPNYVYYTIKSGDNISTIAKKFKGVSESDIIKINGFTDKDVRRLQIGQIIKIKRK